MAQINLLPEDLVAMKGKGGIKKVMEMKKLLLLLGCLLLIFVSSGVGLSVAINNKKTDIAKIEDQWQQVKPLLKEQEELVVRKKQLDGKLMVLETLLGRELLWSKKLAQLRDIVPEQLWFTALSLKEKEKEKRQSLHIKGGVTSLRGESMLATLAEFVGHIKENKVFFEDFQGVELKDVKKATIEKMDIMTFELIFNVKEGQQ